MSSSHRNPFWQPDPELEISHSGNKNSLAYKIARDTFPKVVFDAIEQFNNTLNTINDPPTKAEGEAILTNLQEFLAAINNNDAITPLPDDGSDDIKAYNSELESLQPVSWHDCAWVYSECHLFRQIHSIFATSKSRFWQRHDIWASQKLTSLKSSAPHIVELIDWFYNSHSHSDKPTSSATLEELLKISLWGNAADLLMLLVSSDRVNNKQSAVQRNKLKDHVVVDDTNQVIDLLEHLHANTRSNRRIHIVLDNAGFELVSDLVLVAYLLGENYVDEIVLHGKAFPWFGSDTTREDFETTLSCLSSPDKVFADSGDSRNLPAFASLLESWLTSDPPRITFVCDSFWTTAHPFARLPGVAQRLYTDLRDADLVIFKGDLNYRKLVGGVRWPSETPFEVAIGPLRDADLRILALRTNKGDTCVGLKPGQVEKIDPAGTGMWLSNGEYGVVSFYDGKRK